jgi:hypothetical protein
MNHETGTVHWQERDGCAPGFDTHTVIDATTGRVMLEGATEREFDRWYDHHCFWRQARFPEEINPELRNAKREFPATVVVHYLVHD